MQNFLMGMIAMGLAVISLFFLRYWRLSHDRFFLFFSASFAIEAINRVYLGMFRTAHEIEPTAYLIRLLAYVLILVAIVDKNWPRSHRQ